MKLIGRVRDRVRAEAWLLDVARRHPRWRQLRQRLEHARAGRLVRAEGSVDAALDRIVQTALQKGTCESERTTT